MPKRIIVFTSDSTKVKIRLKELKSWLLECKYPITTIDKAFHNAKLQRPANDPKKKCKVVPLVSMYSSNYSNKDIVTKANNLLANCDDEKIKNSFRNKKSRFGTQATTQPLTPPYKSKFLEPIQRNEQKWHI